MRITKQTTCANCGAIIKQHGIAEIVIRPGRNKEKHAISKCAACGHLQELELVPVYEWTQGPTPPKHVIAQSDDGTILASIIHVLEFGYWLWLTPAGSHGKCGTLEMAIKAADDYINTNH